MRRLLLILAMCMPLLSVAQPSDRPSAPPPPPLQDRLWAGGSFGGGFSNFFTFIDVSPRFGYMVTDRWSVGPGFSYQFLRDKLNLYDSQIFGPAVFTRYQLFDFLFVHGEYEHLFQRYRDDLNNGQIINVNTPGFYGGVGLSNAIEDFRSMGYIMILYNFNESRYTPAARRTPIIQFGFQFGL